jgi:hypothetical protein
MRKRLNAKLSLFLSDFNETWIFLTDIRKKKKKTKIQIFITIRPVGGELYHTDRHTDMTKIVVAFRNFANAPKN